MKHLLMLALVTCPSWALDLKTSAISVQLGNDPFQTGLLNVGIVTNEFPTADPEDPVYLKFCLPPGFAIANTLAKPGTPVNLHVYFTESLLGDVNNTTATAVRLVRFITGETCFYVQINQSTSTWIVSAGSLVPPALNRSMAFNIGIKQGASAIFDGVGNAADTPIFIQQNGVGYVDRMITLTMTAYGPGTDPFIPLDGELWPGSAAQPAVIAEINNP